MTTEQTTGTPGKDDGDAAAQTPTTGTPEADGRDAGADEPDYKAMYLASKDKVEEANRLKAELDEIRARSGQPPADTEDDDSEDANDGSEVELTADDIAQLRDLARRGDVAAKAHLATHLRQAHLARDVRDSFQLRDIDDRAERRQVLAHYARNRHRLGDVKAAEAEIRKGKLESENERLRKELEAARKQPPTDVARTLYREVSSSEAKTRKMTYAEFDSEQAELRAKGQHHEAMKRQRQLASGEIDIP